MQILPSAALALLRAGGYTGVSILVDGTGGTITLEEGDLVENSFTFDRNSVSGDKIEIGNAETSELMFDLDNSDGRYDAVVFEGAQLTVDLVLGADTLRVGIFTVDQPPRRQDILHIVTLDNMAKFNRPYAGALAYPATLTQILQDACTQCGVTLATTSFLNGSYSVTARPTDVTCHEIVAAVAELAGCCAWMDHLGQLKITWYADTGAELGLADLMGSYQMAESDITITGIRYEDEDYIAGTEDYALVIEGNPLLQAGWQAVVDAIYTAIGGFTYRPWAADSKGYPHLWPLDIVNPLTDSEGVSRVGIITNHKYTLGGLSALSGVGETETVTGYATAAPFTARQKTVIQKTAELEASTQLTPIQQMAIKMNALAAGAMALNSTEYNGITYWHDASTLAGSTYIAAFTDAGFMWTDAWNGGSPVWNYGFTSDGDALFRYLSVKGLSADWMTLGGRLSSLSGTTYFDLTTGVIHTPGNIEAAGFTGNSLYGTAVSMSMYEDFLQIKYDGDLMLTATRSLVGVGYPVESVLSTDYDTIVLSNFGQFVKVGKIVESTGPLVLVDGIELTGTVMRLNGDLYLNGVALTATAAELNYVEGVTSAIQTQLDWKKTRFVNNYSQSENLDGWTAFGTLYPVTGRVTSKSHVVTTTENQSIYSAAFDIDPSKTYKVTLSMMCTNADGARYLGLQALDVDGALVAFNIWTVATRAWAADSTAPYFKSIAGSTGGWVDMEGYICGYNVTDAEMPTGKNVDKLVRMAPNMKTIRLRYLNNGTAGVSRTAYFWGPSVTEVDLALINREAIEATLTGAITSHTHSYLPLSAGTGFPLTGSLYIENANPAIFFLDNTADATDFKIVVNGNLFSLYSGATSEDYTDTLLTISNAGVITLIDGGTMVLGTTTGFKIGTAATQKLAFYGATPIVKPSAYTQTYSTASKTLPAFTSATLTDWTGGTANLALVAVEATYTQATIRDNFADLVAMVNKNTVDVLAAFKVITQIINDLQALGLVA